VGFAFSSCLFPFLFWFSLIWVFTQVLQKIRRDITQNASIYLENDRLPASVRRRDPRKAGGEREGARPNQPFALSSWAMSTVAKFYQLIAFAEISVWGDSCAFIGVLFWGFGFGLFRGKFAEGSRGTAPMLSLG
jgi:hypothetical protein